MVELCRRVFLPVPDDYYDLDDDQQLAVCEQMALAGIAQSGTRGAIQTECPDGERGEGLSEDRG